MAWEKNITGVAEGSYRSLNGAADESIFQGRASKAGYFCFFKVWRDMPYDAVLDHAGNLYRVEVKGSSGDHFVVTRGGRAGQQIVRDPDVDRTRIIEREDCDFVVGIDSNNGDCYIIPTDIIEIIGIANLSQRAVQIFREKWELFKFNDGTAENTCRMSKENTRDGLCRLSLEQVHDVAETLNVVIPTESISVEGHRRTLEDEKEKAIYSIWKYLAEL